MGDYEQLHRYIGAHVDARIAAFEARLWFGALKVATVAMGVVAVVSWAVALAR